MSPAVKKRKTYSLRFSNIHETSGIRTPDNLIKRHLFNSCKSRLFKGFWDIFGT